MAEPNLAIICPKCQIPVSPRCAGFFVEEPVGYEHTRYSLGECPLCESPMLLRNYGFEDSHALHWGPPVMLYPATEVALGDDVPPKIAQSYAEAQRSFAQAGAYTATAILCRRTLEGICAHFGEPKKGKSLPEKLDSLRHKGIVDARVHDWANNVLKELGNDAAHDVDQVIEKEHAKDALEFTRAILEYVFVFQAAFERFKAEREERKASKAPKEEEPA